MMQERQQTSSSLAQAALPLLHKPMPPTPECWIRVVKRLRVGISGPVFVQAPQLHPPGLEYALVRVSRAIVLCGVVETVKAWWSAAFTVS